MNAFQQNKEHASETAIESISIETYPLLIEVTDFVNWDNLQKFIIGTKTFYTNGELTYEQMDVMNWDSESRVRIVSIIIPSALVKPEKLRLS